MCDATPPHHTLLTQAILTGWMVMFVGGLSLIISLLFSITSIEGVLNEEAAAGGNAMAQVCVMRLPVSRCVCVHELSS